MLRRNREIHVFNLSLMDVICGAMGAFLIVTVVLSNYYEADPQRIEGTERIRQELEQALALVATLGARVEAAEALAERAAPPSSPAAPDPSPQSFVLTTYWAGSARLETWLIPDTGSEEGARAEFRDLHLPEEQRRSFPRPSPGGRDATYTRPSRFPLPTTFWVVRNTLPGGRYRVYLDADGGERLAAQPGTANVVMELVRPDGSTQAVEGIQLGQSWENLWHFAAVIDIAPDGAVNIRATTVEEHEREKERLGL